VVESATVDPHPNRVGTAAQALSCLGQRQPSPVLLRVMRERLVDARLHKRLETRMRSELSGQLVE
jgi:hypothetical protein